MSEVINPNAEQLDAIGEYVRENMTVVKSQKSGKFYVTLTKDAQNPEIAGIAGRLSFAFIGLTDATQAHERRVTRIASDVSRLSSEEKAALLDALTQ